MLNKTKPIIWRGRKYVYDTEEKSFAA